MQYKPDASRALPVPDVATRHVQDVAREAGDDRGRYLAIAPGVKGALAELEIIGNLKLPVEELWIVLISVKYSGLYCDRSSK